MPAKIRPTNKHLGAVDIIGQSPQTQAMLDFIHRAANDFPVLLEGESGTGKELMALAIHTASARASGPFVAVNCGAMNPNLIESELFGHEKGAFTGAVSRKLGRFERANKGTLFLDEIGELPLQDQVKLLRALQERRIERVGGTEEIEVDFRIIAATNRVLPDEVEAGNFRQDLYYRLAVMTFIMPPLRDRVEDIPPLARHFLDLHCERMKLPVTRLTPEAEAALLQHHWPGNVRELENVIERTLALNGAEEIKAESLVFQTRWTKSKIQPAAGIEHPASPDHGEPLIPLGVRFDDLSASEKRELINRALQRCYGNRTRAAALLGLSSRHRLFKHLEGRARNPQRKLGDETLGEYYKTKLKLNEGEYSTLLGLARECEAETNAHTLRRKETIDRLRAQYPGGKIARDNPPPLPEEVKQLQREYEDLLAKFSNKVKIALRPAKSNELATYLKNEFGPQLKVRKVDLPREKDPSKSKLPPMAK